LARLPAMLLTRAARITLIVLVLLFLAYYGVRLLAGATAGALEPGGIRQRAVQPVGDGRRHPLQNPVHVKLELRDFSLPDADGAPLLAFKRLLLDFDVSLGMARGREFCGGGARRSLRPRHARPDGSLNLADLAKLAHPSPPSDSDETPRVFFIDPPQRGTPAASPSRTARGPRPSHTELRPINFELRDFQHRRRERNAYSLRGASVDGETFAWSGSFRLTPLTSRGKFEVSSLKARTVWSYLREALPSSSPRA
jgi:hypothetical protein